MTSIQFDRLVEQDGTAQRRAGDSRVPSNSETTRRLLNVAVAMMGILVTLPLMLLVAVLIKLTSKGPVLFTQTRVGLDRRNPSTPSGNCKRQQNAGGKPFTIYKFRTMSVDGPVSQVWASPDDPRITPVGRVLRKTRLDELPQLLNVLRGEMNVVGPRPEQLEIFAHLRTEIPGYEHRQRVLPGITGWAQVNGFRGNTSPRKRLVYDLYYVRNWSFAFDLWILLRTPWHVVEGKNAY